MTKEQLQEQMRIKCKGQSTETLKQSAELLSHPNPTSEENLSWIYVMAELEGRMDEKEYLEFEENMFELCEG